MGFSDDLNAEVNKIIQERWDIGDGRVVPEPREIQFSNAGVRLDAVCLYADLADSTSLVNKASDTTAAQVFKCFLNGASRTIRAQGGTITAFDGDRVMAIFIGETRFQSAVRTSFAIGHAVKNIVKPALERTYGPQLSGYSITHGIGIDSGKILAARAGFRNSDDLIWIGPAANYAAKLSGIREGDNTIWITEAVYNAMPPTFRANASGTPIWQARTWTGQNNRRIYTSSTAWGL